MAAGCELVIFDCDGVLVDSERITHEVLADALRELGMDLSLEDAMRLFMGNAAADTIAIIESHIGRPLPAGYFDTWRQDLYRALRERPVRAVPGVETVLEGLTVPVCVVSNGPLEKMRTTLGVTGLLPRFVDALFSPDLGLPGKPAPDMFVAAAERFGADPARSVVVEDSAGGVLGARRAGMRALGYTGAAHTDADALAAAGAELFDDMSALPALIAGRAAR